MKKMFGQKRVLPIALARVHARLACRYARKGLRDEFLHSLRIAKRIFDAHSDSKSLYELYREIAYIYLESGKHGLSYSYIAKAILKALNKDFYSKTELMDDKTLFIFSGVQAKRYPKERARMVLPKIIASYQKMQAKNKAEQIKIKRGLYYALIYKGIMEYDEHRYSEAKETFLKSASIANRNQKYIPYYYLGIIHTNLEDFKTARDYLKHGSRYTSNVALYGYGQAALAKVEFCMGEGERALRRAFNVLGQLRNTTAWEARAELALICGDILLYTKKGTWAESFYNNARGWARKGTQPYLMMLAATRLGYLYALNERFSEALAMYEEAYQHAPDHYHQALIASIIGVTNIKNGDIAHGLGYIGQAEALRSSLKTGEKEQVDLNIAEAYLCAQEEEKAISYLNNILEVSVEPAVLARAYELLSYACRAREFHEQASVYAKKSFENYITAGYRSEAARVVLTLDEPTQGEYRDLAKRLTKLDACILRKRSRNRTNSPLQYLTHY